LHRLFHGHNGGTFTRSDVAAAVQKLSATLGFDISGCRLTKVAFGANLTGVDVQASLRGLTDYKGKVFLKYERGRGITGAKRLLTELELKAYDKSLELKKRHVTLPSATLRFELTSRKQSYLKRLGVCTVADLATPAFFATAKDEIIARLEACGFTETLDYSLLSGDELEALALVDNLALFSAFKANRANKDKATRRSKLAAQAKQKATKTSVKLALLGAVQNAILQLA
jgi:hypothetical protein